MVRRRAGAVMTILLLAASCGGSDDGDERGLATAPTVVTLQPDSTQPPTTEATTTTPESTEPTSTTIPPMQMVATEPVSLCAAAGETPCVDLQRLELGGSPIVADWEAVNFVPSTAANHAHFYWNTFDVVQAGSNAGSFGAQRGSWELTDQQPFTSSGFAGDRIPAGATGLCVTAANANHGVVDPAFEDCMPLPAAIGDTTLGHVQYLRRFIPVTSLCIENSPEGRQTARATLALDSPFGDEDRPTGFEVWFEGATLGFGLLFDDVIAEAADGWQSTGVPNLPVLVGRSDVGSDAPLPITFRLDRTDAPIC